MKFCAIAFAYMHNILFYSLRFCYISISLVGQAISAPICNCQIPRNMIKALLIYVLLFLPNRERNHFRNNYSNVSLLTYTHNIYLHRSQQVYTTQTHTHTYTNPFRLRMRNIERIDFLLDFNRTHAHQHARTLATIERTYPYPQYTSASATGRNCHRTNSNSIEFRMDPINHNGCDRSGSHEISVDRHSVYVWLLFFFHRCNNRFECACEEIL